MRTAVTCIVVAGDGPLNTKWLKDGRPLSEQELDVKLMQEEDGFISTLTFKNLTYKHNGNYTCISMNDVASGTFSATLTVKGKYRCNKAIANISKSAPENHEKNSSAASEVHNIVRSKKCYIFLIQLFLPKYSEFFRPENSKQGLRFRIKAY